MRKGIIALVVLTIFLAHVASAENAGLNIKKGDSGDLISAIQNRLILEGYSTGKANGRFGEKTAEAVRSFQNKASLEPTGVIDTESYYSLYKDEYVDPYPTGYDNLQKLYFLLRSDMSYEEIVQLVELYGLPNTNEKYNGSRAISIAFTEGAAKQSHADSGDSITISFDETSRNSGQYTVSVIEYFNQDAFITVFEYVSGTYWDFRDGCEQYAGLYINDYKTEDGITIEYDNGNKCETKYKRVNNKTEQFAAIK